MSGSSYITSQAEELLSRIRSLDNKFRKSCDQILLLNNQIEDLQIRYDRAMGANRRSFRYSIRLRLATLEGARNMFYEYASRSADKLEELQNELIIAGGEPYSETIDQEWEPVTSSEDEEEEEEEITAATTPSYSNVDSYSNDNSDTDRGDLENTDDVDSQDLISRQAVNSSSFGEKSEGEES